MVVMRKSIVSVLAVLMVLALSSVAMAEEAAAAASTDANLALICLDVKLSLAVKIFQ